MESKAQKLIQSYLEKGEPVSGMVLLTKFECELLMEEYSQLKQKELLESIAKTLIELKHIAESTEVKSALSVLAEKITNYPIA